MCIRDRQYRVYRQRSLCTMAYVYLFSTLKILNFIVNVYQENTFKYLEQKYKIKSYFYKKKLLTVIFIWMLIRQIYHIFQYMYSLYTVKINKSLVYTYLYFLLSNKLIHYFSNKINWKLQRWDEPLKLTFTKYIYSWHKPMETRKK